MNKYLVIIFFSIMLVFVVILWTVIYHGKKPPGKESPQNSQSYTSIAEQIKKNNQKFAKAEALIRRMGVNEEFESMVDVPAGEFFMGVPSSGPVTTGRKVNLASFKIDKYEVTFAQFYKFVEVANHRKPRLAGYLSVDSEGLPLLMNPYNPVVGVSWDDAREYCEWKQKRLPAEAEWEKAAKGTGKSLWPWGDDPNPLNGNFVGKEDGFLYTAPVGSFPKDRSPYGVMDMAGNVMEWVNDWYKEDIFSQELEYDPAGPASGQSRVIRGGSWNDSVYRGEVATRFKMTPEYRDVTIGFRCAKSS